MSNPVTNAEVEDVLSSIRRLVSEDKRPIQSPRPAPPSDRLVLTPALRVAGPDLDDDETGSTLDADAEEDLAAALDAAVYDDIDSEDLGDPAKDYAADPYNFAEEDDDEGEDIFPWQSDRNDNGGDAATGQSGGDSSIAGPAKAADAGEGSRSSVLSEKIAALETAIGRIPDRWEPDTPDADEYSGTSAPAMAWEDDVQRDATGARLGPETEEAEGNDAEAATVAPEAKAAESDAFEFSSDDQLIDEEALRDLVSEIVRAELQGALGERITRNVRKLVRREIHRALTAQDLE